LNNKLNDHMMRVITASLLHHSKPKLLVILGDLIYNQHLPNSDFYHITNRLESIFTKDFDVCWGVVGGDVFQILLFFAIL
jgi:glycine/serine hydroxymethyltransferase